MKTLMSASVVPADECASSWTLSDPGETVLSQRYSALEGPYDWREDLKLIAKQKKWWLRKDHLKDFRSAFLFMTKKKFFDMQSCAVLDTRWNVAFELPEGSVVIGNADGDPVLAVWEEELPTLPF